MSMGGSSSQPTTTTQTTSSAPWSGQENYLLKGYKAAEDLYNDQTRPTFYPGQTFAGPSQQTLAANTYGTNEAIKQASGYYLDPANNQAMMTSWGNALAKSMPGIMSPFIGANRSGSGLYGRAMGEGVAAGLAPLYEAERQRQVAAPQQLQAIGAQNELWAQKPIDEAMSRFDFEQNAPYGKLANYMQMVQGNYGGQSNTTSQQFMPKSNSTAQGIGTALSAVAAVAPYLAMAAGLSDRRVKKDIKKVGKTDDGLPVYTYRYKWEGPEMAKHMGVMAQDVEKKNPEAVGLLSLMGKAVKAVDYSRL